MKKYTLNKITKFITCSLAVLLIACESGPAEEESNKAYSEYVKRVETNVSQLPKEKQAERDSILTILKSNPLWQELVKKQTVSAEYLLLLTGISDAVAKSHPEGFYVPESIREALEEKNQLQFLVNTVVLEFRGGLPEEIVYIFDRYQKRYKYYGQKGDSWVNAEGNREMIENDYNLAPAIAVFDSKNTNALDALQESVNKGIYSLVKEEKAPEHHYPYLVSQKAYIDHLKAYYPNSKHIPDWDFELSAQDLLAAYEANEVSADEKFKDKKLAVTGKVISISKDIMGDIFVLLEGDGVVRNIQCYLEDASIAGPLEKGQIITVVGICDGLMMNVQLQECEIR